MNGGSIVSLVVSGDDVDPDDITKRVGLTPTRGYRKGDAIPNADGIRKTGSWELSVSGPTTYGAPMVPNDLAVELLDRIAPHAAALAALPEEIGIRFRFDDSINPKEMARARTATLTRPRSSSL